jgi:Ca2+-binding RTX toxin-like protein
LIFGAENIVFGYDFIAANAASTSGYLPMSAATIATLVASAYPVSAIGTITASTSVATIAGYASQTSAAPLDSTLGVTAPANTLSFTIPAAAGAVRTLGVQWQSYDATTLAWTNIAGAVGATFRPSAANALVQGTTIRAAADFITATNQIRSIFSTASAPLGLEVVGTAAADALVGTAFQDVLYAGAGNDTLDGGVGADFMDGGAGNDGYTVDNVGDVVVEALNGGTDTVTSSITHTLGANVENLTLSGTTAINGTGNTLANVLIGNAASNTLAGGAGADTFRYLTVAGQAAFSTTAALDTIADFAIGSDVFDMTVARNAAAIRKVNLTGAYSANTLAAQFTTANFAAAGDAAIVSFSGTPTAFYLVVNTDGTAGYSNADFVIRVNYTGTLANFAIA